MRFAAVALAAALLAASAGCGYRIAGRADTLPDNVRTVAVPAFDNATTEYKIEQFLTQAVVREFLTRTRYRVVDRPEDADATLRGAVVGFVAFPQNFDPVSNRATTIATITRLQVTLWDQRTGAAIYQNPNLEHRERYEVSADPEVYFEERQAAIARASETMARAVVSSILEGF